MSLTVAEALREARRAGVDALDAQMMLSHLLARPRAWLIAHDDEPLAPEAATTLRHWVTRRAGGEPLAYLLGEKEFHGLRLHVDPRVLIPRPDTETLVDWALELLAGELAPVAAPEVVDLGTGSGAIAVAVAHAWPRARVTAVDASEDALAVARGNAQRLGVVVNFRAGDWWAPVACQRFHLALSNPPYIDAADEHLAALRHEPSSALVAAGNGLADLARIAARAAPHLEPGGWLLLEHGWQQAPAVQALLATHGLRDISTRIDLGGQQRCTGGRR